MNTDTTITERMVPTACQLAGNVREGNRHAINELLRTLTPRERYALTIVLAAMIPTDQTPRQLLAWIDDQPPTPTPHITTRRPCGTHAAYARHKANGEPIDARCLHAERAYQRNRKRAQRRAA